MEIDRIEYGKNELRIAIWNVLYALNSKNSGNNFNSGYMNALIDFRKEFEKL